jgi:hypothetical protein
MVTLKPMCIKRSRRNVFPAINGIIAQPLMLFSRKCDNRASKLSRDGRSRESILSRLMIAG